LELLPGCDDRREWDDVHGRRALEWSPVLLPCSSVRKREHLLGLFKYSQCGDPRYNSAVGTNGGHGVRGELQPGQSLLERIDGHGRLGAKGIQCVRLAELDLDLPETGHYYVHVVVWPGGVDDLLLRSGLGR